MMRALIAPTKDKARRTIIALGLSLEDWHPIGVGEETTRNRIEHFLIYDVDLTDEKAVEWFQKSVMPRMPAPQRDNVIRSFSRDWDFTGYGG